jgi:hypothetical protein
VVRTRFTEYANDARQCRFRSGTHVQRLHGQPHRVDADHRSNSRSQPAHSAAAVSGQLTFTIVAPRRSSIAISCDVAAVDRSSGMGMNVRFSTLDGGSAAWAVSIGLTGCVCSSVTTQRRSRFAFSPFASATAAIDTPRCRQADTTFALNAALWVHRRRRTMPLSEVSMCPRKTQVDTIILTGIGSSKMTSPTAYPDSSAKRFTRQRLRHCEATRDILHSSHVPICRNAFPLSSESRRPLARQRVCVRNGTVLIDKVTVASTITGDAHRRSLNDWSHRRRLKSGELFLLNASMPFVVRQPLFWAG